MRLRFLPVLLLLACRLAPAPVPMARAVAPASGDGPARCLMVLLPGGGDKMEKFAEEGFVAAIRASGLSVTVVSADATVGYYARGILGERLERDVMAPSRPGHEHVWLLGVSMGGLGTVHYTQQYPEHVDGILALAPYLGRHRLVNEIRDAGGLARWSPDPPAPLTRKNYQRQLWSWLHRTTAAGDGPVILLGYGRDDALAFADGVLAEALPGDRVFTRPGKHDWPVWRALLADMLRHPALLASCAVEATREAR
jgi:pimeloyl-ACP methyl ester carboxylesterase